MNPQNHMQKFKIFYSWQSDLPGNKTKNFIRECIDEAIDLAQESEAIEAERDEATTGTTGSPDIVATLFSKIDNCDLFIADLSLCYTEDQNKEKRSPNPNVLLELGYAVKTLGWDRIICLCNTDYGNKYPFDISHNRITDFSLEGKSRKEVKGDISKIIFVNIRDIRKQPLRAKGGAATHLIGTYDFENHKVIKSLVPVDLSKQESYILHNKALLDESSKLFAEIQKLTERIITADAEKDGHQASPPEQHVSLDKYLDKYPPLRRDVVHAIAESFKASETSVVWADIEEDKARIKHWLNADVSDEFFDLGGLKQTVQLFGMHNPGLNGTDNEKTKYDKLHDLSYKLVQLDVRTNYIKTFDEMYFIPLAIQNISSMQDTNIRVVVKVEIGEVVEPDEHLIAEDYEGFQGLLCRDDEDEADVGIICELFGLYEDGIIHTEIPRYDPSDYVPEKPLLINGRVVRPEKTSEDYKWELEEYIASTERRGYYEFDVESLRPGECKWLYCGMLIKPVGGEVKVHYQIHSAHSTGDLNGVLEV